MMIFYDKVTGEIVGTVHGRIHAEEEKRMWIGNKEETDRIIYEWSEIKGGGFGLPKGITEDEKRLLIDIEEDSFNTRKYAIDLKTGRPKRKSESVIQKEEKAKVASKNIRKQKSPRDILLDLEKRIIKLEMDLIKVNEHRL